MVWNLEYGAFGGIKTLKWSHSVGRNDTRACLEVSVDDVSTEPHMVTFLKVFATANKSTYQIWPLGPLSFHSTYKQK